MHVGTGKFVTVRKTASDTERGALKVVLQKGGNTGSGFAVLSGYSTKQEGGKALLGEVFRLESSAFSGLNLSMATCPVTDRRVLGAQVGSHSDMLDTAAAPLYVSVHLSTVLGRPPSHTSVRSGLAKPLLPPWPCCCVPPVPA